MASVNQSPLALLSTGIANLDKILGGGIPAHSVTVIAGDPGSGKTVFTLQTLFHLARQGNKCIYFSTLSEPALKGIRYMQLFSFFDSALLDNQITFFDLGSSLRDGGLDRARMVIMDLVERQEPTVIAIDSFKALQDLLPGDGGRARIFSYDLLVQFASWGVTTLLVGGYPAQDILTRPEFAIADGILRFSNQPVDLTIVRILEIVKLRGADYVSGHHFFEIRPEGIAFYPRVRGPEDIDEPHFSTQYRMSSGLPELDEMLGGGFPRASVTMVKGGTGVGKTLLGLQFLIAGARAGEPCVHLGLEETPVQLRTIATNFGWDLASLEREKRLVFSYSLPVELSADRFLAETLDHVQRVGATRMVLDSITAVGVGATSERRYRELICVLTSHLRSLGVTSVLTLEAKEFPGETQMGGYDESTAVDNVIWLRYVELDGALRRAIGVLKARGVVHSAKFHLLSLSQQGLAVGPGLKNLHGVLSGIPVSKRTPGPRARIPKKRL